MVFYDGALYSRENESTQWYLESSGSAQPLPADAAGIARHAHDRDAAGIQEARQVDPRGRPGAVHRIRHARFS